MRRRQRPLAIGILGILVVIVEQDQVDIGAGGQFAAAEFAHAEQSDAPAGDAAMTLREEALIMRVAVDSLRRS